VKAILTIRTDKPEAEVGVYDVQGEQLSYRNWQAHRQLSSTLLGVIRDELAKHRMVFHDIAGVVVFRGPGSFTGLRIGITVANTLAHELKAPIVGVADENEWLERGLSRLRTIFKSPPPLSLQSPAHNPSSSCQRNSCYASSRMTYSGLGYCTDSRSGDSEMVLKNGDNDQLVLPEYGGEANITLPKKFDERSL
jgi:hypothetical protein